MKGPYTIYNSCDLSTYTELSPNVLTQLKKELKGTMAIQLQDIRFQRHQRLTESVVAFFQAQAA